MRVTLVMMQKNEGALLDLWLAYHAHLFGAERLHVVDNGSTDPLTLEAVQRWRQRGVDFVDGFTAPEHFVRKGEVLGDLIKLHEPESDFLIPLDCDEFVCTRLRDGRVSCDIKYIERDLSVFSHEKRVLRVSLNYFNIPGTREFYSSKERKTLFVAGTFKCLDRGFHEGRTIESAQQTSTPLRYIHFRHKPFGLYKRHALEKLRPVLPDLSIERLARMRGHLGPRVAGGPEAYYAEFADKKRMTIPSFEARLRELGHSFPFADDPGGMVALRGPAGDGLSV